ncbi:ribosomal protein L11 [Kockovaella imperatae]|uniref:Large ribosomal subunit protein uL11m n=1 Tax=Kockovaella imperatae TaxID=4999 RepID=A0A1Y1URZ8_9TREE|nr:ribosomal protein L11 [Kockovaella imperatae]ORX40749.1 ribosomal protein L11 [Kockovaella imperatae]
MSKAKAAAASIVRLTVPASKATPSPPVGPALGSKGVKAIDFCKEFNARTAHLINDTPVPCLITVQPDRTFSFEIRSPPVSYLIKQAAGIEKGSGKAGGSETIGKISLKHLYEIAKIKATDPGLSGLKLESVARSVLGSCRSMGVKVEP